MTVRKFCIYTKKQQQTCLVTNQTLNLYPIKIYICPLVAGVCAAPLLTVASGISIALMAKERKNSLAYLECINNKPSGGSMSLGVINKTFALALITAAAPW